MSLPKITDYIDKWMVNGVTYSDDGTVLESWTGAKEKSPNLELWYLKSSTQYVFKFTAATNYRIQWAELT